MGRPLNTEMPWFVECAAKIVREDKTFKEAVEELKLALTTAECEKYRRQKEFQAILRTERLRFYRELANDPEANKAAAVGKLLYAIDKLEDEGQFEKVVEGVLKLAKIQGWLEAESNITVFAGLSQRELDAVKERLLKAKASHGTDETGLN